MRCLPVAMISILLVGLLGWTTYEFISAKSNKAETTETSSTSGAKITSEIPDEKSSTGNEENSEELEVGLQVGNLAPDFELETLSGDVVKLSDYRGKKVMVNFWATWCPPCREEIPEMQKFYEDTDVEILAINLTETESNIEEVDEFVDEYGMTFPVLLDSELTAADTYRIQPIPSSFILDTTGVIQYYAPGALYYEQMVQAYNSLK